jgi:hypothetical protein
MMVVFSVQVDIKVGDSGVLGWCVVYRLIEEV